MCIIDDMDITIDPGSEDRQRVTVYVTAENVRWLDATRAILGIDRSAAIRELIDQYGDDMADRHIGAAKVRHGEKRAL